MAIIRWRDPFESKAFRELNRLQDEMNTLFDRVFGRKADSAGAGVFPPVNVSQDDDNIYVTAELPGIEPKDLEVIVEEDSLTIKGERTFVPETEDVSFHRREREQGAFNRTLPLNTRISSEDVKAETKNGILTLILPKAEEVKPKKIEIKVQ